ncbi:2Fe-2S iron-sulfur cluster-binding protein [Streptomyces scabiei]|uniref:2Fe-2S iron-sulfur cluster-binding protein n=1 Tax=Streptomyces scabiei TaxID=1930 RepID=UPI0029A79076|nr:2Fe-2S iron-sulfur cluster-binding protein [Streptomyces scabiei]MDX3522705.1 2Fe-2S iron-sulfur cluster-binding protein [Streptomyces scabiei]
MKVILDTSNGISHRIEVDPGQSLMVAATANGVSEIVAECGGTATCGTCHVWVDPAFTDRLPDLDDREDDVLDGVIAERRPTSRLACQIELTADLDGLVVVIPEEQW